MLGHVTLAWNDCHSTVLSIFHSLAGVSWAKACTIFLALKSDRNQRDVTLELMEHVLNGKDDEEIRKAGEKLFKKLGKLATQRNLSTHTMWVTVLPEGKVQRHPGLPPDKRVRDDVTSQFSNLTKQLRSLLRELWLFRGTLDRHLHTTGRGTSS